jgi:hypothetical protein
LQHVVVRYKEGSVLLYAQADRCRSRYRKVVFWKVAAEHDSTRSVANRKLDDAADTSDDDPELAFPAPIKVLPEQGLLGLVE